MRKHWVFLFLQVAVLATGLVTAQITIPNSFSNGTVADANQVNANFTQLGSLGLNRTGGTMTGTLNTLLVQPTANGASDLGAAGTAYRNLYLTGTTLLNTRTYTWPASESTGGFLSTNGSGALSWAPPGCTPTYVAKSALYTAVANDRVGVTSGSFTVTLPAASANLNKCVLVENDGTGTTTIGRTGSDTIGLATSATLGAATASSQGDSMTFLSDGVSNWAIY